MADFGQYETARVTERLKHMFNTHGLNKEPFVQADRNGVRINPQVQGAVTNTERNFDQAHSTIGQFMTGIREIFSLGKDDPRHFNVLTGRHNDGTPGGVAADDSQSNSQNQKPVKIDRPNPYGHGSAGQAQTDTNSAVGEITRANPYSNDPAVNGANSQVNVSELPPVKTTPIELTPAESIARIDEAQRQLNSDLSKPATKEDYINVYKATFNLSDYSFEGDPPNASTRGDLNSLMNFRREVLQDYSSKEVKAIIPAQLANDPAFGQALYDHWKEDVIYSKKDPASADYNGGSSTILDSLGKAVKDPTKAAQLGKITDINEFIRTLEDFDVPLPPALPSAENSGTPVAAKVAQVTAPVAAEVKTSPLATVASKGPESSADILNRWSREGAQVTQYGQGSDMTYVALKDGKVIGGMALDRTTSHGTEIARDDLDGHFEKSGSNKRVATIEAVTALATNSGASLSKDSQGMAVAATNIAAPVQTAEFTVKTSSPLVTAAAKNLG